MKRNPYKVAFFSLLGLILVSIIIIVVQYNSVGDFAGPSESENNDTSSIVSSPAIDFHIRILIDSVKLVKDSINLVSKTINDSLETWQLSRIQMEPIAQVLANLSGLKTDLDLKLDETCLLLLKSHAGSLKSVIVKFDKAKSNLSQLAKRLERFSAFIKTSIDIFDTAVRNGIIVPFATAS